MALPTTQSYNKIVAGSGRKWYSGAHVRFADESEIDIDERNILASSGFGIEDATSETDKFQVGAVIINELTLRLNNYEGDFNAYDFNGAVITPWVGLVTAVHWRDGEIVERLNKGIFTVFEAPTVGSVIDIAADDNMAKLDTAYSASTLAYPAMLGQIAADACSVCGVTLATATFPNSDYIVAKRPSESSITCREILSYVAQLAGCFARCNVNGAVEIRWYEETPAGTNPYSGKKIEFKQGVASSLSSLIVAGKTIQDGTGTPSPDNVRPLHGIKQIILSDGGSQSQTITLPRELFDDDAYEAVSGQGAAEKVKALLNETGSWYKAAIDTTNLAGFGITLASSGNKSILCDKLRPTTVFTSAEEIYVNTASQVFVRVLKSRLTGWLDGWTDAQKVAAFKTWLTSNPVTVLYTLASPLTITGAPQAITTYAPKTIITNDADAPMVAENNYLWDVGIGASSISADSADTAITGIQIQGNDEAKTVYKSGTDDFVVRIESNPLAQDNLQSLVDSLGEKFNGFAFRAYSTSAPSNPAIEAGDIVNMTDKRGVVHRTMVSSLSYQFGQYEIFNADAETAAENQSERFSKADKAQETADDAQQGVTEAKAEITTLNGQITLKADKGSLISQINICPESIKISSDRIELTGTVVLKSDLANGNTTIDGACLRTGRIESQDSNSSFYIDLDTGDINMKKGTFSGLIQWLKSSGALGGQISYSTNGGLRIEASGPITLGASSIVMTDGNVRIGSLNGVDMLDAIDGNWNFQMADGSSHRLYFNGGILTDYD